jgi:hypothetical protein
MRVSHALIAICTGHDLETGSIGTVLLGER